MSKPVIIPNWKYQKPSIGGHRGLKKLLKYVSYREKPDHRPLELDERWTDCGLGDKWREVYENCAALANQYVLAHHLVIAPDPALMVLVPDAQKHELVRELTERVVDGWHMARGLPVAEYSYVLHDRDTSDYGLQNLHTHIFIAGTFENEAGERDSRRVERQQSAQIAGVRSGKTTCTTWPGGSSSNCWIARSALPGASNANANLRQNRRQLLKMIQHFPSVRHTIWR
jgi:hypothetical protein